jgi:hypothetical protein
MTMPVKSSLQVPFKPETMADMTARMDLTTKLGVDVPYIKVGDVDLEVEWTVQNLDNMPGQFVIGVNGANEVFAYDPTLIDTSQSLCCRILLHVVARVYLSSSYLSLESMGPRV